MLLELIVPDDFEDISLVDFLTLAAVISGARFETIFGDVPSVTTTREHVWAAIAHSDCFILGRESVLDLHFFGHFVVDHFGN